MSNVDIPQAILDEIAEAQAAYDTAHAAAEALGDQLQAHNDAVEDYRIKSVQAARTGAKPPAPRNDTADIERGHYLEAQYAHATKARERAGRVLASRQEKAHPYLRPEAARVFREAVDAVDAAANALVRLGGLSLYGRHSYGDVNVADAVSGLRAAAGSLNV